MNLKAIHPRKNLSRANKGDYKFPYLLRNLKIESPNQVWQADITYIPMFRGFMYMFAIIDVYSRKIMGWDVSNTMSAEWCRDVMRDAMERHGKPESSIRTRVPSLHPRYSERRTHPRPWPHGLNRWTPARRARQMIYACHNGHRTGNNGARNPN